MSAPERLARLQAELATAMQACARPAEALTLIAVSKTFSAPAIRPVLEAGHLDFGENRIQEALDKWPALKEEFPQARLHLIGALQSNKAAQAVEHFDAIHSLDRLKLAAKLADAVQKLGRQPTLFVQVNTGNEPQKSGISLDDLDGFVEACTRDYELTITGLMCLPPAHDVPAPHFALLEKRAHNLGLTALSMGMSGDYLSALPFGATHIRLGTAIFGPRG
ncbi:MAG: YggS family pyridoxal phosphate-dependent enzyme [Parvibaculales bacterium]